MMGRREGGQGQFLYAFDLDKVVRPNHGSLIASMRVLQQNPPESGHHSGHSVTSALCPPGSTSWTPAPSRHPAMCADALGQGHLSKVPRVQGDGHQLLAAIK
jgi:hypothetical protein